MKNRSPYIVSVLWVERRFENLEISRQTDRRHYFSIEHSSYPNEYMFCIFIVVNYIYVTWVKFLHIYI